MPEFPPALHPAGRLLSVSQPCPGLKLRDFLRLARGGPRFAFELQRSGLAFAGAGITAELVAWSDRFQAIESQARALFAGAVIDGDGPQQREPRLFGGFAFQNDFVPDNTWTIWSPAWFVLPHYQFSQSDDGAWLTLNVQIPSDEDPSETLAALRAALRARCEDLQDHGLVQEDTTSPRLLSLEYPMTRSTWERIITTATQRIRDTALEKVVLSRVAEMRFSDAPDVNQALDTLRESFPDCWRFLFEPRSGHAFFGATPELLAELQGRQLRSMALAGSAPRGNSSAADEALAQQLLGDRKERHEHALVVDAMRARLADFGKLQAPAGPQVLKLANIQHLLTPLTCTLHRAGGLLPLVELLHPTPALGGAPRELALEHISELEPVPRGWFAAPLGFLDMRLDGTFVVAIRSAVSQERRLWLYAGVGVVKDSVAQREWEESELKFQPALTALGLLENAHG